MCVHNLSFNLKHERENEKRGTKLFRLYLQKSFPWQFQDQKKKFISFRDRVVTLCVCAWD